ncbi:hypothetical protein [Chlamydia suis]|nr:hypothetical protein [Chlamydia suis]
MKKLLLLALVFSSCALHAGDTEEEKNTDSLVTSLCCGGEEEGPKDGE